ncbi:MAG: hypothetical protein ACREYC_26420 [Gammaproteobacteria bacterium]
MFFTYFFNASFQRAMFRRTGWAVIWRSRRGKRSVGAAPVVGGGSRWVLGVVSNADAGAPVRVRGAATGQEVPRGGHLPAHALIELILGCGVAPGAGGVDGAGHPVRHQTVSELLQHLGYSLQVNRKTREGCPLEALAIAAGSNIDCDRQAQS